MAHRYLRCWYSILVLIFIDHCLSVAVSYPLSLPNLLAANGEKYAIVTANSLNIRSEPSTQGKVVVKVTKGARLEILKEEGEWLKVRTQDGKIGWGSKKFMSLTAAPKEAVVTSQATPQEKAQPTASPTTKITKPRSVAEPRTHPRAVGPAVAYGVLGGIAYSQLAGKYISDEFSARFGFTAGALAYFRLNHFIGIQPEILYVMKGAVKKSGGIESILHFDYIDLPILLRIKIPVGTTLLPYITIGPLLSYNIQAIVTDNGSNSTTRKITDLKKFDYGVSAGGGLQFFLMHQNFLIDARYYLGLAQIHDAETNPLELKNKSLTVTLAWMLH